jgi:hypothetical protein
VDLDDTPDLAAFRAQVREWLEVHASEAPPPDARDAARQGMARTISPKWRANARLLPPIAAPAFPLSVAAS